MATTIKSSALDFDTVKANLKSHFKSQSEFSDYDFEASGLSNILDVLAYNTHINGLTANFALNESFLNTAQLRSSVVSHAEALGYVPRSYTAASATVQLSITISPSDRPTSVTLPKDSLFTSSINNISYTFRTLEDYTGTDDGSGKYQFKTSTGSSSIPIYEGAEKTKTFLVGSSADKQVYVIPDITADINTLSVAVYETASSSNFETYTNLSKAIRISPASTHYQVKEVPNGYYEIIFGDGLTTGKTPVAGNKIIVTYLSVKGSLANEASTFLPSNQLPVVHNSVTTNHTISVDTTVTESAGGAFKESIESIRQNAPIQFATQQRMVTAEDYKAQILSTYNAYLDDVISWGGSDNVPVEYGKVFVGLKFNDNISDSTKQIVKDGIKSSLTDNLAIMSITTEYVDPVTCYLELHTTFNFDPDLTSTTIQTTQTNILSTITSYFNDNLKKFEKVFRRSNLISEIDDLDTAILNSKMDVKMQLRINPTLNVSSDYTLNYPVAIALPDDEAIRVTTSRFTFNTRTCSIKNKLGSNTLQVVNSDSEIEADNIGSFNPTTGQVSLVGFNPTAIEGAAIKVSVVPSNESTIRPLRNYVLDLDTSLTSAIGVFDYQNTKVVL